MSIATDLIKSSMRLIGVIAAGETPRAEELNDALDVLNDILEDWSTESLAVWGSSNQTFNTVAGQATYTIGPAGNFNTARPIDIHDAYCTYGGVDFPVKPIAQEDYNRIVLKTQQQPIVERLLYVNENPLGVVTLWPVPSQVIPLTISCNRILTAIPTLATALVYPPGYQKALRYNLAVDLAAEYGKMAAPDVIAIAKTSKGNIKTANITKPTMRFDGVLMDSGDGPAIWQRGY